MCGIVAIFRLDNTEPDANLLEQMARLLRHRGPDEQDFFFDGPIGLGHNRLIVIDPETGHQPMSYKGVTVAFNGEIYNYIELRQRLEAMGHVFTTSSDVEVLLHLYLAHGPDFVRHLNGMFAFVLWDANLKRLMAARDHVGLKPLYWHVSPRRIVFASEIKAILLDPEVKVEPNLDAIMEYLALQYVHGEATLFKGINKIMPAEYKIFYPDGKSQSVKYWEPKFRVDYDHTEKYFLERLRSLIEDSVRIQLRADVSVGTTLSGGMDSSLVTILAARHSHKPLHTFTGAFAEGPEFDETPYAQEVSQLCGAVNHIIYPTPYDFIETFPSLVWYLDEPAGGPGVFPQFLVARLARQYVKVCLGGQGGDEIFGGYARYVVAYLEQALKGAIFETNEEGEHIVSLRSILPNLPYLKAYVPMLRRFWSQGAFDTMDRRYFCLIDRSAGTVSLLSDDLRTLFDKEAIFARFQAIFNHPDTLSYYNKMTHYDLVASLPALLHVEDRATMAASLESRAPLLDWRIIELVASMPPPLKFKGAEMKYVLKKAVGDIIPPRVLARKEKMGFPVPLHLWVSGPAREFFRDVLLSDTCRNRGLFNMVAVERLLDEPEPFDRRIWGLLNLELWFQIFIDKKVRPNADLH